MKETQTQTIINIFLSLKNEQEASHLSRFFKTGIGEYGFGDKFLGIRVPKTREIVKKFKDSVSLNDINSLIDSEWHEIRLCALLFLIELYKKKSQRNSDINRKELINFYLNNIKFANNWDLVDLSAPYILGDWVNENTERLNIIYDLADMQGHLWHQRVAIVSTLTLIKNGVFQPTFDLALKFMSHKHHLIHKATGWMLREIGKRGGETVLTEFLDKYQSVMPRTMLRYAIEKFTPEKKDSYLLKQKN